MGCPSLYYKRALQDFAHCLYYMEDRCLAEKFLKETSEERLEEVILEKKKTYDNNQFYYDAGNVAYKVMKEAHREGCDAYNASISGINEFEYLIGLKKDK